MRAAENLGRFNPQVRDMFTAAATAAGLDGRVQAETPTQTRERFGEAFADALLLDQQATGAAARDQLGWKPTHPSLIDELATGSYTNHA